MVDIDLERMLLSLYQRRARAVPPAVVQLLEQLEHLAAITAASGHGGQAGRTISTAQRPPGRTMSTMSAAQRLAVDERTVRRWCARGRRLPGATRDAVTGAWIIPESDVDDLAAAIGRAA